MPDACEHGPDRGAPGSVEGSALRRVREFADLDVLGKAHGLALSVYRLTRAFPKEERYGLVAQMRSAASSVPANIVEGHARQRAADRQRFFGIATGSLQELRYFMTLAEDLGLADGADWEELHEHAREVLRMLVVFAQRTGDRPS